MNPEPLLTTVEAQELEYAFRNLLNYDSSDPVSTIDPFTYRAPDGDTCLYIAARQGDIRSVALLIRGGICADATGDMGTTALHCASSREIADLLVAAGSSTQTLDEFGRKPLDAVNENLERRR